MTNMASQPGQDYSTVEEQHLPFKATTAIISMDSEGGSTGCWVTKGSPRSTSTV